MPRGTPQRGDLTGQTRQKLAEENAKELLERQKEVGLVNQVEVIEEAEGIFDPATGEVIEMPEDAQAKVEALAEPQSVEEDPVLDPAVKYPGYDPMKDLQDMQQQRQDKPYHNPLEVDEAPVTVEGEWKIIRVNTDIEEMTYGISNPPYTFLRGHRYRVPKPLYTWLESRGVIYH
jgi:hypothetical protein